MLKEGQKAPNFNLLGDDGEMHSLASHKGKFIVLYFYPKDMTPGCTTQACEFSEQYPIFEEMDAVVYGVSKDSLASHTRFKSKYGLQFTLLSDPDLHAHKAYHAYGEKVMYGKSVVGVIRCTFLIDPDGNIAKIWNKVRVKGHVDAVAKVLQQKSAEFSVAKPLKSSVQVR